jgi:acyl dehydratase
MTNPIRSRAADGLRVGDSFRYRRTFTLAETRAFGDMTRDYNPVHYDPRWADVKGFGGLICHGLLVGSMICEFGGQVGWLATAMSFRFVKPVYDGDRIECRITITGMGERGRAEAEAVLTNQEGVEVGYAQLKGRVPLGPERDLLKRMLAEGDATNKLAGENYGR